MLTKEDRKKAVNYTIEKSLDGNMYYLLLSRNCINTFVTSDKSLADFYIKHYGHSLYAKCKDGHLYYNPTF